MASKLDAPAAPFMTSTAAPGAQWSNESAAAARAMGAAPSLRTPATGTTRASRATRPTSAMGTPPRPTSITVAFVRRSPGCPPQLRLQVGDGVRQDRLVAAPHHREAQRAVERREVAVAEPFRLSLPDPHARHALP